MQIDVLVEENGSSLSFGGDEEICIKFFSFLIKNLNSDFSFRVFQQEDIVEAKSLPEELVEPIQNELPFNEELTTAEVWMQSAEQLSNWTEVRALRKLVGLNQITFAKMYGCKAPTICNNEKRGGRLAKKTKLKIMNVFQDYINLLSESHISYLSESSEFDTLHNLT